MNRMNMVESNLNNRYCINIRRAIQADLITNHFIEGWDENVFDLNMY